MALNIWDLLIHLFGGRWFCIYVCDFWVKQFPYSSLLLIRKVANGNIEQHPLFASLVSLHRVLYNRPPLMFLLPTKRQHQHRYKQKNLLATTKNRKRGGGLEEERNKQILLRLDRAHLIVPKHTPSLLSKSSIFSSSALPSCDEGF